MVNGDHTYQKWIILSPVKNWRKMVCILNPVPWRKMQLPLKSISIIKCEPVLFWLYLQREDHFQEYIRFISVNPSPSLSSGGNNSTGHGGKGGAGIVGQGNRLLLGQKDKNSRCF